MLISKNILYLALSGVFAISTLSANTHAAASVNSELARAGDFVAQVYYLGNSEVLQIQLTSRTGDQPLNISLFYKGRVVAKTTEPISNDPHVFQWDISGFPDGAYEIHFKTKYSSDEQRFKKR